MSLNIILRDLIAILKATIDSLPQILILNESKYSMSVKTATHCEPMSVFHDKDVISHSVYTFNDVKKL